MLPTTYVAQRPGPFAALIQAPDLGGFLLDPLPPRSVRDRYFDTEDGELLRQGLALRVREQGETLHASLRSLRDGAPQPGAEAVAALSAAPPDGRFRVPDGPLADVLARLLRPEDVLVSVLGLRQYRTPRLAYDGSRLVGLFSFDVVVYELEGAHHVSHELEIERARDGRDTDLLRLDPVLREHGLEPVPYTKYERGLLRVPRTLEQPLLLLPDERAAIETLLDDGSPMLRRRARVILLDARGFRAATIAAQTGLSVARVRHWKQLFRERRMDIFADEQAQVYGGRPSVPLYRVSELVGGARPPAPPRPTPPPLLEDEDAPAPSGTAQGAHPTQPAGPPPDGTPPAEAPPADPSLSALAETDADAAAGSTPSGDGLPVPSSAAEVRQSTEGDEAGEHESTRRAGATPPARPGETDDPEWAVPAVAEPSYAVHPLVTPDESPIPAEHDAPEHDAPEHGGVRGEAPMSPGASEREAEEASAHGEVSDHETSSTHTDEQALGQPAVASASADPAGPLADAADLDALLELFQPGDTDTPVLDEAPAGDDEAPKLARVFGAPTPATSAPVASAPVASAPVASARGAGPMRRPRLSGDERLPDAAEAVLAYQQAQFEQAVAALAERHEAAQLRRALLAVHRLRLALDVFVAAVPERLSLRVRAALRPLARHLDHALETGGEGAPLPEGPVRAVSAGLDAIRAFLASDVAPGALARPADDLVGAADARPGPTHLRHVLATALWARYEEVRAFDTPEATSDLVEPSETAYHLVVACAGLHYVLGLAEHASTGPVREASALLERAEAEAARLDREARRTGQPPDLRPALEVLLSPALRTHLAEVAAHI